MGLAHMILWILASLSLVYWIAFFRLTFSFAPGSPLHVSFCVSDRSVALCLYGLRVSLCWICARALCRVVLRFSFAHGCLVWISLTLHNRSLFLDGSRSHTPALTVHTLTLSSLCLHCTDPPPHVCLYVYLGSFTRILTWITPHSLHCLVTHARCGLVASFFLWIWMHCTALSFTFIFVCIFTHSWIRTFSLSLWILHSFHVFVWSAFTRFRFCMVHSDLHSHVAHLVCTPGCPRHVPHVYTVHLTLASFTGSRYVTGLRLTVCVPLYARCLDHISLGRSLRLRCILGSFITHAVHSSLVPHAPFVLSRILFSFDFHKFSLRGWFSLLTSRMDLRSRCALSDHGSLVLHRISFVFSLHRLRSFSDVFTRFLIVLHWFSGSLFSLLDLYGSLGSFCISFLADRIVLSRFCAYRSRSRSLRSHFGSLDRFWFCFRTLDLCVFADRLALASSFCSRGSLDRTLFWFLTRSAFMDRSRTHLA